ncbi:MAG: POTRA domain-containing protein [bacterium]|nr:POTRA domain-containing protein [bacterium]
MSIRPTTFSILRLTGILCVLAAASLAQSAQFEGREIRDVSITFEGTDRNISAVEQYRLFAREELGERYAAVRVRNAIERLYKTKEITSATVEASDGAGGGVDVRFIIRRKTRAQRVVVEIPEGDKSGVTEQELLLRLNILEPGTPVTETTLNENANTILEYLRDRGFFRAEVESSSRPLVNDTEVAVTFTVKPNAQATVERFDIAVEGFDNALLAEKIKLKPGAEFTREKLQADTDRIKTKLRDDGFLAPQLDEPRPVYDSESNRVAISLAGRTGPTVTVEVEAEGEKVGSATRRRILPVVREGTVDFAAIIEGERRLETQFQEQGYFFVNVRSVCAVEPPLKDIDGAEMRNATEFLCSALSSAELQGKGVEVRYIADLDRRLTLKDIRLTGTDLFTITEIESVLESQVANILGIIPLFGYGNGYTSAGLLEEDAATIRTLLRELGYRDASVRVNQGVSPDGEDLIITFVVEEGVPTVVTDVEIRGNSAFTTAELVAQLPVIKGKNISRARNRNGQRKLAEHYSNAGYFDAKITVSDDDLGIDAGTGVRQARIIYTIENENKPVYVSRILIAGQERTKEGAIRKALNVRENELLRSADIYSSEQNLYASDAFSQVVIRTQPVGNRPDGGRNVDVIVSVTEQPPRILSYGGGLSTDLGASGFVDLRHLNLLGNLWQGGVRLRASQRQQLFQVDFINPRFIRDGEKRFAPLTITGGYQRDTTVTRFFRSAFDQGTFGIVQRLDAEGNPVDEFGNEVDDPTLNRITLTAETNRTLSLRDRSIVFFRYRFEDVRLYNIESLLIKNLLEPDSRIRISGFGATFVRDTRQKCSVQFTIFDIIARGDAEDPCRYNAGDPTKGSYITAEYNVSVPFLGANVGFSKFQATATKYYTFNTFKYQTTVAARGILGVANLFSGGNRFPAAYPGLEDILPISERFFAGGSNTLRGFDFESAGPRVVVVPTGNFFNQKGEQVFLDPFTVPFGGNALAVVNVEARVPLTKSIRVVPFYDGGNVFRSAKDIFSREEIPDTEVFRKNLQAKWTHTVGLGLRIKTPIGGEAGIDYGYLLNPPSFVIPQAIGPPAFYRLPQSQVHFRFSQAF